jgi:hypothetical protein
VPGEQQQEPETCQVLPVGALGQLTAEQVVGRLLLLLHDQRGHVVADLVGRREAFVGRDGLVQQPGGATLEELVVGVRHAEQLTDDQRRHRQ